MSDDINNLKLTVGLLQRDFQNTEKLCDKLSESIEKMQEVNANLVKLISLHEQKHQIHTQTEIELKEDVKDLHSRITTVNRDLQERMDQMELHIERKIDVLREDLREKVEEKKEDKNLIGSIKEIDKYKWMILGAATGFGWVISNVNLNTLASLFK